MDIGMFKSAEYTQSHEKSITLLHCTLDCSGIPLSNEDSKCTKHWNTNAQTHTHIKQVQNNVSVRMPP